MLLWLSWWRSRLALAVVQGWSVRRGWGLPVSWVLLGERGFSGEVQVSGTQAPRLSAGTLAEPSLVRPSQVCPWHGVTMEKRHQPIKQNPRGNLQGNTQWQHQLIAMSPSSC